MLFASVHRISDLAQPSRTAFRLRLRFKLRVEDLSGAFGSDDGQRRIVQQPDLLQHASLVPIDVLVSEFAVAEMNNGHQCHFDAPVRRRNAG